MALLIAAVSVAGCSLIGGPSTVVLSTVGQPVALSVENRGGPTLSVRIDGAEVLQLPCNDTREISPGVDGIPQLPWVVTVARLRDDVVVSTEQISVLPQWYLQIGDSALGFGRTPPLGPAGPTCGPA